MLLLPEDKRKNSGNFPKSNVPSDVRSVVSASTVTSVFQTALPADGYATTLNKRAAVCGQRPCNSLPLALRHEQSSTLRYKPVHSADSGNLQAYSNCYLVPASFAIFGLHAGIMNFNTQNEE